MRISMIQRCLTLFLTVTSAVAYAQTVGGTILGTVTDPQGSVVPDASVVIRNVETGIQRALATSTSGTYQAANLQPGTYELTVDATGFAVEVRRGINLTVGAERVADVTLTLGSVAQTVEVTAGVEAVELNTGTISHNVDGTTIRELPLNGRDWTQLATLQPGISSAGTAGGIRGGTGVKISVSGARPSENNFRLDGISLNDQSNNTPGNILGVNLGVEAVREFTVVSNNYSAEYGRATGGVLNAVTRSGTNDLHGTLFYFHRNSAVDARNFFDRTENPPPFRRHQFGAAVGGPLVANRTFWFADYEGVRQFLGTTSISNTLSQAARSGNLSTGQVTVDPEIARVLPLYPLPNGPLLGDGDTGQFFSVVSSPSEGHYILGKIDHSISASDSLAGSYFFDTSETSAPNTFLSKISADTAKRQSAMIEHTHVFSPTVLNVARIGFLRNDTNSGQITQVFDPLLEDSSLGFIPGKNIGGLSIPGLSDPGGGPGAVDETDLVFNSFQFHENVYVTMGSHNIKFGASVERMQYNFSLPHLSGGQFSFGSVSDFLTNRPSTFAALYPESDVIRGLRQTLISSYVQDDIRLASNLTVNVGLRYEFLTIPNEVNGKVALLQNIHDPEVRVGGPILDRNPSSLNFSPRVGVVWDPFKDQKTSIRASFGMFDSLPLVWLFDTPLTRSTPFFLQGVAINPPEGIFPDQALPLLTTNNLRTAFVEREPSRPYSMKWNLSIEREVMGWLAEIGYTGSRGVHLPLVERNMNARVPTWDPAIDRWVYDPNQPRPNPNFSAINTTDTWNADSYYQGLQTSVRKTLSNGFQIQASYTWSKSIDTGSSTVSTSSGSGYSSAAAVATPQMPFLNRGLSDFDVRHQVVISSVWQLPFASRLTGLAGRALDGWQLGGIYRGQTGTPFSVVLNNDRANSGTDTTGRSLGQRPDLISSPACADLTTGDPNAYIKTECFLFPAINTLGNAGRNILTSPGLSNLDFSLFKNFQFGESMNAQFRVETFNLLNHANFSEPNFTIFDRQGRNPSNVGQITSTRTSPRQFQFGLKINF